MRRICPSSPRFVAALTAVAAAVSVGAAPAVAAPMTRPALAPAAAPVQTELPSWAALPQTTPEAGEATPVTVVKLSDGEGVTTPVAEAGKEELADGAGQGTDPQVAGGVQGASAPTLLGRMVGAAAATPAESEPQDVTVLSEPLATDEFFVAGVTWSGSDRLPDGTTVYLRVMEGDTWSPWQLVEAETLEKDEQDVTGEELTGGTSPFVAGGATAVQVQVASEDGETVPSDLALTLVPEQPDGTERVVEEAPADSVTTDGAPADLTSPQDATRSLLEEGSGATPTATEAPAAPGASGAGVGTGLPAAVGAQAAAGRVPAAAAATALPTAVARPSIISRAGWGANESLMTWTPREASVRAAVVHHTAGTNSYSSSQSASIVRNIYYYHAVTRGWGDVGYNFLFDKYGRIYEGRAGSLNSSTGTMVAGAHASGYNTGTVGLSAMGDYSSVWAPQLVLDNMAKVAAWKFSEAGIDAQSSSGIVAPGTNYTAAGTILPRIFGHRDVANVTRTTCPGPNIGARLGAMRSSVAAMTQAAGPSTGVSGPVADPNVGYATWYLNNNFDNASDLQFVYGRNTDKPIVGDWDGDGKDTAGLRRGATYFMIEDHTGGSSDSSVTYGTVSDQTFVGDWDGDGKDTIMVRRGTEFHLNNSLTPGPAEKVIVYGLPDDEVLVGDWDGDGKDSLAVRRGTAFLVRNSLSSGVAEETAYYGRVGDDAIVGDWNGDRRDTIGVVRGGNEFHLRNQIAGGVADVQVTYGRTTDEALVGDWDGNGIDTLGLRRQG